MTRLAINRDEITVFQFFRIQEARRGLIGRLIINTRADWSINGRYDVTLLLDR